jgi:hypothetical protein
MPSKPTRPISGATSTSRPQHHAQKHNNIRKFLLVDIKAEMVVFITISAFMFCEVPHA